MKLKTAKQLEDEVTKMSLRLDSPTCTVSDEDIDRGLELIEDVHAYLEQIGVDNSSNCVAVLGRCVAILGATGVGESTVVSLLFGQGGLLVHHEDEYTAALIAEKPIPGVDIQHGSLSKTLVPGIVRANVDGKSMTVFDMPGTHDTRGPFAELVTHSVMEWLLANHKNVHFVLVATPPQERSQAVALASSINRACATGANVVVVFTKCDADFNPKIITKIKEINPDNRSLPTFALPKPKKSDKEGDDFSSLHCDTKIAVLGELVSPVAQSKSFTFPAPDSAKLLLQSFCNRSIAIARDALSLAFINMYNRFLKPQFSLYTVSELLSILENPDALTFEILVGQLQQLVLSSGSIAIEPAVQRAGKRLKLMERWSGCEIIRYKDEWLSLKCRAQLERVKRDLSTLRLSIVRYHTVQSQKKSHTIVVSAWHLELAKDTRVLSDIKYFVDAMNSTMTEGIPTVVLIGFKSITIDVVFRIWANVVIVSPEVSIKSIDLSTVGQATHRELLRVEPGKNGAHGAPGRPGGNLFILCENLHDAGMTKRSKGQRGCNGQNAGDAVNNVDTKYDELKFKNDLEALIKRLNFLKKSESVSGKLPFTTRLEAQSKRELPPDSGHLALTAAGSAIAATAVAVSGCIPLVAPIVAPTMLPVATGMIGKGMQRNTQTKLVLERSIEQRKGDQLPGCRGPGGYGGRGGEFCIVEAGHKVKKWRSASGEKGHPGLAGNPFQTVVLKGTVAQEYDIFGCRRGEPSITITVETFDPRYSPPPRSNGIQPRETTRSSHQSIVFAKCSDVHYEDALAELKRTFPQCDFNCVKMP